MKGELILRTVFGSKLYGTDTPASDTDYKEIWIPPARQIIMGGPKVTHMDTGDSQSANTSTDIDTERLALHYFMKLLIKGETMCLDMLHSKPEYQEQDNVKYNMRWIWEYLQKNRAEFYTTNMSAFTGYARQQATKYSAKGDRMNWISKVISITNDFDGDLRLREVKQHLPVDPVNGYSSFGIVDDGRGNVQECYECLGRKFLFGIRVRELQTRLSDLYKEYGARAIKAADMGGKDWKALSHAARVLFEAREIYQTGNLIMPLDTSPVIRKIKLGQMDIKDVQELIDYLYDDVQKLAVEAGKNGMRKEVDREKWENWVYKIYSDVVWFDAESRKRGYQAP